MGSAFALVSQLPASDPTLSPLLQYAILFGTGLAAGTINVLAGGGSTLTLPVLIFLGLPPTVANGTNRVAILVQNLGAVWGFNRHGVLEYKRLGPVVLPAILGSVVGTVIALNVGDVAFQQMLGYAMLGIAAFTLWDPVGRRYGGADRSLTDDDIKHPLGRGGLMATFFLVGVYGGFLQVGVGLILLAVTTAWGLDLVRGNALKVLIVLCFTPLALGIFAATGNVDWAAGTSLGAGTLLGGLVGVRLNLRMGHRWLKKIVAVVVVLMAIRLLISGQG